MGFKMSGVDHYLVGFAALGSQTRKDAVEHAHPAPSHKAVIECLMRPIGRRRVSPTQTVPDDEDDPGQHFAVIDTRNTMRQGKERFDPAHPGIVRLFRHPVLVALALWAGLHLLPNGDLAHVILFGIFTLFAIAGRSLINRRKTRQMGRDAWERLDAEVARQPLVSVFLPVGWVFWRLCIAVAVYVSLLALHPVVIGVPAL